MLHILCALSLVKASRRALNANRPLRRLAIFHAKACLSVTIDQLDEGTTTHQPVPTVDGSADTYVITVQH